MTNLLQPPCAEADVTTVFLCQRCGARPGTDCGDTAARAAQEAVQTLGGSQVATPSPEAPTALPDGMAEGLELPWRMEGSSIVPDGPARRYGPITSYVGEDDGAYIVLAANHHAALVEALEACERAIMDVENAEDSYLRAAINSALPSARAARALLERIRAGGGG